MDLLLSVARRDPDVLISPAPSAMLEGFGESGLLFALYAFVPDPALVGPVRHRLCSEIQRRFAEEGIVIPLPTRELHVSGMTHELDRAPEKPQPVRRDAAATVPPEPHARRTADVRAGRAGLTPTVRAPRSSGAKSRPGRHCGEAAASDLVAATPSAGGTAPDRGPEDCSGIG